MPAFYRQGVSAFLQQAKFTADSSSSLTKGTLLIFTTLIIVIGFLLAIVGYFGPRVALDTHFGIPELPDDLDAYLLDDEARHSDITPGAEKKIAWANPELKNKTRFAFVYLHGFSATRQESMPVPGNIARHFESNIYYARLTGNGRSDDAMAKGSVNKWINDAAQALAIADSIGDQTIIIGCSTGASLGWWIAHQEAFRKQIHSLVFLSPNFGVADPRAGILLWPWGAQIAKAITGDYRESKPVSPEHEKYWACRYPTESLLPMMGMVKLTENYSPKQTPFPVHVTYSPHDDTVNALKISAFYKQLASTKETLVIDQPEASSQHVIVGDILAPQNNDRVTSSVIAFIEKVS